MHCRQCGYSLLNLSAPRCPECGTDFDIRGYRFQPGSVAFACPSCGHQHGGTGERYLPALTEQAQCLQCGQIMAVAAMRVVPLRPDAEASADGVPWEERGGMPWWKAWGKSALLGSVFPHRLGPMVRMGQELGAPYRFATLTTTVACTLAGLSLSAMATLGLCLGPKVQWYIVATAWGVYGGSGVLWGLGLPLLMLLHAGAAHLVLTLTGPIDGDWRTTARCLLYCAGPQVLAAMPMCGCHLWLLAYLWTSIAAIFALMGAQRVSAGRAIVASLWFPVTGFVLLVGGFVALILATMR